MAKQSAYPECPICGEPIAPDDETDFTSEASDAEMIHAACKPSAS